MRKILLALLLVISLVLNFVIIDSAKSLSFYNTVEKTGQKINFSFDKPKKHSKHAMTYFQKLSKRYDVDLTKVTHLSDNRIVINSTDKKLRAKADEHGKLNVFDHTLNIKIYDFNDTHISMEGTYFLSGSDDRIHQVIHLIQKNVGYVEKEDNAIHQHLQIDLFSVTLLVVMVCIFFTVLIHYLRNGKHERKVLYDMGYRRFEIFKFVCAELRMHWLVYLTLNILLSLVIYSLIYKKLDLLNVLSITLSIALFMTSISLLVIWFVTILYAKHYAKNIRHHNAFLMLYTYMALSILAIILLASSTQALLNNYSKYEQQTRSMTYWHLAKNAYKTELNDNGQVKNKALGLALDKKLKRYYNSDENKGFIIDAVNFDTALGEPLYKFNEKVNADIEPDGKTVTIDKRYLKAHKISTINQRDALQEVIDADYVQNIIVPVRLKEHQETIRRNFADNFTFRKDIDHYENKINKKLNINIIWAKNNSEYFTYDSEIGGNKNSVKDPIAIVETGNTDAQNFSSYYSQSYVFKSTLDDPYDTIREGLKHYQLDGYITSLSSVYDAKVNHIQELKVNAYKYIALAFLTGLVFVIMVVTFIQLYFRAYQYKIFIKRNLGFSYGRIHRWLLSFLLAINVLMAMLLLRHHQFGAYMVYISIVTIELVVVSYTFMKQNKENANLILKGKKDD